jgi:ABC-type polar amino acid transport system ATPase subunit
MQPLLDKVKFVSSDAERLLAIEAQADAALVSDTLPLRANLSALENIAVVPQYRRNLSAENATQIAWVLLSLVKCTDCALKRDPDLTHEERFLTKLLRAVVLAPPAILVDRPGQLLPDTRYPEFLEATLALLEGQYDHCIILDYQWNAPLYSSHASGT